MTQKKPLAPCHAIFNFPAPLLFSCIPPNKGLFWKSCLGICFWCGERQTLIRHLGVIFFAQTAVTRMFSPSLFSVGKTDIEESNSSLKSYMWSFRSDRGPLQRLSLTGSGGKAVLPGQSGCTVWRELLSTARYRRTPAFFAQASHLEALLLGGPQPMPFSGASATTALSNGPWRHFLTQYSGLFHS